MLKDKCSVVWAAIFLNLQGVSELLAELSDDLVKAIYTREQNRIETLPFSPNYVFCMS